MNEEFKLNDNGTYNFEWTDEVMLEIANDWFDDIVKISKVERYIHDDMYVTFTAYRRTDYPEYDDSDYNMLKYDTVYTDWEDTYYNFSDNYIMWIKVDDLKSDHIEVLYLPLIYKHLDIHHGTDIDKHLFVLAITIRDTFIEDDLLHRMTMELYFEDFNELTFDEHCNNKYEMMEWKHNLIKTIEDESQD